MKVHRVWIVTVLLLSACVSKKESKTVLNPSLDFRPNIVWIVAEDMSPTIPAFGDSTIVTPNLDRLSKEGVCYDHFFSPHPVCSPARAAIITGMYANSIGASHMRTGPWMHENLPESVVKNYKALPEGQRPYEAVPPPQVKMFTEYLRATGYYCSNNNKEDYQFIKTMTAWDESSATAHWRNRAKDQPFFSVFNIGLTHESRIWAKAEDLLWVDPDIKIALPPYLPDTELAQDDMRRMYSNILEMDAKVGSILRELEVDGLMDRTIIVWYTDHGGPLPRQKRLLYDSGIKVPMIIRFPEAVLGGQRDSRMISFVDLAPTTLSLAGVPIPGHMQGSAFLGSALRQQEPNYVFGAADRFDEYSDNIRSARDRRFKYIKNHKPEIPLYANIAYRKQMPIMQELLRLKDEQQLSSAQSLWFKTKPEEELYDLEDDPFELKNLAAKAEYQIELERLRRACENWVADIGDQGLRSEQELIQEFWPNGEQPRPEAPKFSLADGVLTISSATDGATIGYRKGGSNEVWNVYTGPLPYEKGDRLEAIAHRLGYQKSSITQFNVP